MEWPDPALKVRDRARFAHSTACSPRLCDDACRVPAELGARGATAPAREGAGAAAAGGRTARQPAQQRPAQRPPAQQPEQPVRALRGEYCRPAALRRPGGSTRSNFASRARAEARAARARPAASRRRRNMAYSTALEEEEEAGWQCCMPPRGSFGVLSPSQGAAEGVRSRDNPPPQPRPVEAHLGTAMRSPLGAPGGRSKVGRAPMGGGCVLLAPHRAPSVRTGVVTEGWPAQGLSRGRSAPSAVSRSHAKGTQWEFYNKTPSHNTGHGTGAHWH